MNKRSKNMLVFILSTSMIFANMIPVFAEEVEDDYATIDSIEETAVLSCEDMAELDWVDIEYPDKDYTGLPHPFSVICDSKKGEDYSFSRIAPAPYEDVILVSFTNGYDEHLRGTALNKDTKSLRIYNEGSITASYNEPEHSIGIQGYNC